MFHELLSRDKRDKWSEQTIAIVYSRDRGSPEVITLLRQAQDRLAAGRSRRSAHMLEVGGGSSDEVNIDCFSPDLWILTPTSYNK